MSINMIHCLAKNKPGSVNGAFFSLKARKARCDDKREMELSCRPLNINTKTVSVDLVRCDGAEQGRGKSKSSTFSAPSPAQRVRTGEWWGGEKSGLKTVGVAMESSGDHRGFLRRFQFTCA